MYVLNQTQTQSISGAGFIPSDAGLNNSQIHYIIGMICQGTVAVLINTPQGRLAKAGLLALTVAAQAGGNVFGNIYFPEKKSGWFF